MFEVLLVEDDEILSGMYQQLFSSAGYGVIHAEDAKTGLVLTQSRHPDVILLDIMLPKGQSGFDFLEQVKKNPDTKNIPVIVLTNLDSEEKVAKEIGAVDYLVKVKTKPDQVLAKVNKLLTRP